MNRPTAIALALSIATTPVAAQTTKPQDATDPCMTAKVALMTAEFESSPINNSKKKSAAKIKQEIAAAKKQVAKDCKASALPQPYKIASLTATFS